MSARQTAHLQGYVAALRGQLVANNIAPVEPSAHWSEELTAQERRLMKLLIDVHPDHLDLFALDQRLPSKNGRPRTNPESLRTVIHHIRRVIGNGAIEVVYSEGYRAGPLVMAKGN